MPGSTTTLHLGPCLGVALVVTGCAQVTWIPLPCPGWDEIAVTDPDGVADEEDLAEVAETLADFATWNGGESTCVGEVRLIPELFDREWELGGHFVSNELLIELSMRADLGSTLIHELCHAWDHVYEFSSTWEDIIPDTWWIDPGLYDTEDLQRRERFADACAWGPPARALTEAADAACGDMDPWTLVLRIGNSRQSASLRSR